MNEVNYGRTEYIEQKICRQKVLIRHIFLVLAFVDNRCNVHVSALNHVIDCMHNTYSRRYVCIYTVDEELNTQ